MKKIGLRKRELSGLLGEEVHVEFRSEYWKTSHNINEILERKDVKGKNPGFYVGDVQIPLKHIKAVDNSGKPRILVDLSSSSMYQGGII